MSAPIPRRLLTQTAWVAFPSPGAAFGGEHLPEFPLRRVRMDPVAPTRATEYQAANAVVGTLYVDAVNSDPAVEVPAGSLVRMEGEAAPARAHRVTACLDERGRVHHWEVELR